MRLPVKQINVLGDRYQVRVVRMKPFGECVYADGDIRLRPDQSKDQARDTLLHEVIHAIDHIYATNMTEEQVRTIATGLRAVFTANPKFAEFVSK